MPPPKDEVHPCVSREPMDCKIKLTWLFRGSGTEYRRNLIPADLFYFHVPLFSIPRREGSPTVVEYNRQVTSVRRNDKVCSLAGRCLMRPSPCGIHARLPKASQSFTAIFDRASSRFPLVYRDTCTYIDATSSVSTYTIFFADTLREKL